MCCFNNDHDKSHNIINIKDEETLKDNGISYKGSISEFDYIFQKAKNIKQKIESEIKILTSAHKTKLNEITEYYKYQCNYLNEKVAEMKIELNKFLKEANNILLSCENIFKATENSNINDDNYEIKTLFYISEIYKNNEKAKMFFKKPIRNLNLNIGTFSNPSSLFGSNMYNYTYYYFSGITIPKNITVYKNNNKLSISWLMDELRTKDPIKFYLHIKINGEESIYENNTIGFSLDKYDENADYEIKIRACINETFGDWSETKKFKISELKTESIFANPFIANNNTNKNIFGGLFTNSNLKSTLKEEDDNIIKDKGLFRNNNIEIKSLFSNDKSNEENKNENKINNLFENNQTLSLFGNNNDKESNIISIDKINKEENKI